MPINNEHPSLKLHSLYLVFLCFCLMMIGLSTFVVFRISQKDQTVTVLGQSTTKINNQIATFSATVTSTDKDKQTAVTKTSDMSNSIVDAVKKFGIPENDILTTNLNVYQNQEPVMEKGVQVYRPTDWTASYTINVTLRDLTKSTDLTSLLANFDGVSLYGPNLQIDETMIDEGKLLQSAIDNARAKAQKMALESGKHLGDVITMSEVTDSSTSLNYTLKGDAIGGGGGGLPIQPGVTETQKSVIVTYKLY